MLLGFLGLVLKRNPSFPFLYADWNGSVMAGALSSIWVHKDGGPAQGLYSRLLDRAGSGLQGLCEGVVTVQG